MMNALKSLHPTNDLKLFTLRSKTLHTQPSNHNIFRGGYRIIINVKRKAATHT
ncbi:MAG: hypothetical protein ACJAXS_001770 [Colwellia sp.]|jgi:hypothetical protein